MPETKKKTLRRLDVLDGLRGFAILLVFLNHIDSYYIAQAVPSFFKPFIHFLFTSGNLGVTFFFILSGFLMGYLYSNPQPKEFIERRYSRIFPPFLVMVLSMWVFHLYPATPLLLRIGIMLGVALIARFIWIYIIQHFHKGSLLIKLFMLFQCGVAFWYGLIIMRHPPIWFDSFPLLIKELTIFATNASLTLSLGNYLPQLDGVYWSLAPEIIFYLLYPYLFAPTVQSLKVKMKPYFFFFALSLFPFFFGLSLLFKHTAGLAMLFIEYFIYFCGGIAVANIILRYQQIKTSRILRFLINPVTFLIILFVCYLVLNSSSGPQVVIMRLLLVFPFSYIVYSLVTNDTPLTRLFQKKVFLFLGTISYSMYIGQTAIVDGMHLIFKPHNIVSSVFFLFLTLLTLLLVSIALHHIIEKPYFQFKPEKSKSNTPVPNKKIIYLILLIVILLMFFLSYSSQYNFFSQEKKYTDIIPTSIIISQEPYLFSFTAQENNMGVILVHLTSIVGDSKLKKIKIVDPTKQQRFQIRLKEKGTEKWYASQSTGPAEIGNSSSYPFGFPPIADSKNKTYLIEMSIIDIDYSSAILFNKDVFTLTTIHQIPKQTLLTNPYKLLMHVANKLQTAFADPEARLTAICITPLIIILFSLL